MPKDQSVELAVRLAVLRNPEVYGLRQQDVNPLLQFVLIGTEEPIPQDQLQDVIRKCQWDCAKIVNAKVKSILSRNEAEAIILQNRELDDLAVIGSDDDEADDQEPVSTPRQNASAQGNGKRNGSGGRNAAKPTDRKSRPGSSSIGEPKVSVKQLRFIGYLLRQLDEEPDYKEIAELTQRQATTRIRELEKELANK